ncbi:hypothetical protein ESA_01064 [Cronobacter sakazakii ATCC BAA-894]|uniref:Uncharacterized protein n=1 Tax=Cronobacter sakazakii (strain ATCC BAA-894) TaxID=290339 RepID=A7MLL5_CROS8|nr:hypothetical protein ESA_01064 [Cronobacter sakazakii ATCC BAA-894]
MVFPLPRKPVMRLVRVTCAPDKYLTGINHQATFWIKIMGMRRENADGQARVRVKSIQG